MKVEMMKEKSIPIRKVTNLSDGFSDACAGLDFSGTLTNVKNKKVFNFSFSYKHNGGNGAEEYEELEWEGDFDEADIEGIAMEVVGDYQFAFCE